MNLSHYIESSGLTRGQFASAIGRTEGAVSHWLTGRYKVSPESAIAIEQATKGAVTRHDLRPDVFGEAPATEAAE